MKDMSKLAKQMQIQMEEVQYNNKRTPVPLKSKKTLSNLDTSKLFATNTNNTPTVVQKVERDLTKSDNN